MLTDAWIGMFIKMGAIKEGQAVGIFGEVAWHPVEDHADAFGVATVYKGAELVWSAKAAGGGVPARDLVAPGAIKGMLRDGHQLDMGKAAGLHIGDHPIT